MLDRPTSTCPTRETLEQFVAGELQDERVRDHLDNCRICSRTAEQIARDNKLVKEFVLSTDDSPGEVGIATSVPEIEGFEILSEIYRGGQGIVYKAIQENTKRTVALKMLLPGPFASKRQRHRFEREIELIAKLRHPNIVTLYESGVSRDGRHYFAMEYIRGRPLDAYLREDSARTGTRRPPNRPEPILRLFAKIAEAVQYAHQRGIIHRDLKPGNILVDSHDEPHVLDFGLAKVLGLDVLGSGLRATQTGEFMGTLAYAAPEQVRGDPDLVDTRTDVYALGVILYEMLTGELPYAVSGSLSDAIQSITEAKPVKLSTYRPKVGEEVETIVLKALSKEQSRRYQSADALRRDVVRYLAGDPIDAKSDSGWYVLKKTIRRHKLPVGIALALFFVLSGATWISTTLYLEREGARAEHRETMKNLRALVIHYKKKTRYEHMEPALRLVLATAERIMGEEDSQTLWAMKEMASLYRFQERFELAEPIYERMAEIRTRVNGLEHPKTLWSIHELASLYWLQQRYDDAERLHKLVLEARRRVLPEDHIQTLVSMNNLASLYLRTHRYRDFLRLNDECIRRTTKSKGKGHFLVGIALTQYGKYLKELELFTEAETALLEARDILYNADGANHARSITADELLVDLYGRWLGGVELGGDTL